MVPRTIASPDDLYPAMLADSTLYPGFRLLELHSAAFLLVDAYWRMSATLASGLNARTSSMTSTALLYFSVCSASKIPSVSIPDQCSNLLVAVRS